MSQQQQPTILDVANSMFGALELAQKRGTYSFQESANIFQTMSLMKQYFQKVADQQQKALAQQKAQQEQNSNREKTLQSLKQQKLKSIKEADETVEEI